MRAPLTRQLSLFVLLFLVCVGVAASPACSTKQRMNTIGTTVLAVDTAKEGFLVWTADHQKSLIDKATSKADAEAKIHAYDAERTKIVEAFNVVYRALAIAATKDDEASLKAALGNALELYAQLKALTGQLFGPKSTSPPPTPADAPSPPPPPPTDGGV